MFDVNIAHNIITWYFINHIYITFLETDQQCFFHNLSYSNTLDKLYNCVLTGTALEVSDGSYFPTHKLGGCGWIISSPDRTEWIKGGCIIPGPRLVHSAYRTELGGLAGIAFFFYSLRLPPPLTLTQQVISDCKSALQQLLTSPEYVKSSLKHQDLISLICYLWDRCQFTPVPVHVYAHQDTSSSCILSTNASLNCEMDEFAKDIVLSAISSGFSTPPTFTTSLGFGTITCNSTTICHSVQRGLYTSIMHELFVSRLCLLFESTKDDLQRIVSWDCLQLARNLARFGLLRFISKFLSGDIATGRVMKRRKHRFSSECPICGATDEYILHLLTCPSASTMRSSLLTKFSVWLLSVDTEPSIITFFIDGLTAWFRFPTSILVFHSSDNLLDTGFSSQLQMGIDPLLCGYISTHLLAAQKHHYIELGSKRTAHRWGTNVISRLWNIIYQIWWHRNNILHQHDKLNILSGLT